MFKRFSHDSLVGAQSGDAPLTGAALCGFKARSFKAQQGSSVWRKSAQLTVGLILACVALPSAGCGNTLYAISANAASSKVEEARELNAEQYAPYEYYLAKEHLAKAQSEAAEADYSDASNLAEAAEGYADKAIRLSREARRGAGR